ncbi:MFS transporter, partial [Bacillus subtilis]|nr:MFS transporter [Bacillus subtilis]
MTEFNEQAVADTTDKKNDPEITSDMAVKALIPLLITFVLGTLCLQGFNLVFTQVGQAVGAPKQASLITALPSIVLGIVCFIYGSLGDFVSLKKLVTVGISLLLAGSVFGFVATFFFTPNIWVVIIARIIQT